MTRLRVIDLETTGIEPPAKIERPMARLYRTLGGIPPETKAGRHLPKPRPPAGSNQYTQICESTATQHAGSEFDLTYSPQ